MTPSPLDDDAHAEGSLRPARFEDFPGQDAVKEQLLIQLHAAQARGDSLDHILLYGPPGLGKTSLAHVLAHEMGVSIRETSGPAVEKQGDLVGLLSSLKEHDIFFIDEIHRLNPVLEEVLYPAMEDFAVDVLVGQGPGARAIRVPLPKVTVIGATTRFGALTAPFRARFGSTLRLDYYEADALCLILERSARVLRVEATDEGLEEIALRARGTPRIANRLLRRIRDFAAVRGSGVIDRASTEAALDLLGVDKLGLDAIDRELLRTLIFKFEGRSVGRDTLAAAMSEAPETVEDVYEPYLLQMGFLELSPRGRRATPQAYRLLGLEPPVPREQPRLI
ncbi:MAG: Holliday junction branch migration DNA helicase RuvB [Chloroflexi bacterium]|nr:Holliday junction branch migration DNA helicase RuvB [Chloroflexota bacterium]